MISFKVQKQSRKSRARLGILKTPHGEVQTPCLVGVATQATVKTLTSVEAAACGNQILICNTFHLHLKPGEKVVKAGGQLHKFMAWDKPLMTDSGGFQVFSLGFGKDLKVGKKLTRFSKISPRDKDLVKVHDQPRSVKITDDGASFKSPYDGSNIFIGPKESIRIQEALGADIMFMFDECTPPLASKPYVAKSLERTHAWAKVCLDVKKTKQALYGIVQGSRYKDLRQQSAKYMASLPFDGYGIGGDLGESKAQTAEVLDWTIPLLDQTKPRHLLGIGKLDDLELIIKGGVDTFDCTVPTHFARHGVAFTSTGKIDLHRTEYLKDQKALDRTCGCSTCQTYTRSYLCHLIRANELTVLRLLTIHNLFYFHAQVSKLREKIERGIL
jgi:queuine tRNA-ribosyltransferase/7-cyano-7-deazaguanine tRNA-ribosyltransferase